MTLHNNEVVHISFLISAVLYAITLIIKVIGSDVTLFANKMIVTVLFSIIANLVTELVRIDNFYSVIIMDIINIVSTFFIIFPFIFIINLRNFILIVDKKILLLTWCLILLIGLTYVIYGVANVLYIYTSSSIIQIAGSLINIFVDIFDIISNIYLLLYYNKYYFSSKSIMKYLRFQMVYRRNWIYFVIFLEIMGFFLIATAIKGIYPTTSASFLGALIFIFDVNTMIDFVKFDTVRNEIVIGDQTINLYDTIRVQSGRIRSLRV